MANTTIKFYTTVSSRLSDLPIENGRLYFVRDSQRIYLDYNDKRTEYSIIKELKTDKARQILKNPIDGFYYVEETHVLWKYSNKEWNQITPEVLNPIFFGETKDFPLQGDSSVLYISNNATYRWDEATNSYLVTANKTEWKEFKING